MRIFEKKVLTLQIQESAAKENEGESLVKIVFLYELNEAAVNFQKKSATVAPC